MKRWGWMALLLVPMFFVGCGGDGIEFVSGTVTLDGEVPAACANNSAVITFHPVDGGTGAIAYGGSTPDGKYTLTTDGGEAEAGARAGDYIVTVELRDAPKPVISDDPSKTPVMVVKQAPLVTPEKYTKKETSDLKVTVKPGNNDIPLALTSK